MNVLILGGTGGSGLACAQEFLRQGHRVILGGRTQAKLDEAAARLAEDRQAQANVGTVVIDVYQVATLVPAFETADLVIQGANPGYLGIIDHLPRLTDAVLDAAESTGRPVVFLEGTYTYGKSPGRPVREDDKPRPVSRKGAVKQACTEKILNPRRQNLRALIVRMPDYYGPTSQLAYLDPTLQALADRKFGMFIGGLRPAREYIYLPDAAERIVRLALDPSAYGQVWNLSGVRLSGHDILRLCADHLGHRSPVWPLGPRAIGMMGWFDPFFRELSEMTYLLSDPLVLDGGKYARAYGEPKNTAPAQALGATLDALKAKKG